MKKRLIIISFFITLFVVFLVVWNYSYEQGVGESFVILQKDVDKKTIPMERGVFQRAAKALDYAKMPNDENHQRSLKEYYRNRAFYGGPPIIPHPISDDRTIGAQSCLQCHKDGGFVPKFNAYAPVTPHPDFLNCRQCHVVQKTRTLFKPTEFVKSAAPKIGKDKQGKDINSSLKGSPPQIPHSLSLRESCLSCHAGPAAPKEIRVTHPERINCRQCHVPKNVDTSFERRKIKNK